MPKFRPASANQPLGAALARPPRPCSRHRFTVLSPHGVVLTAYLQTRDVSPPALSLFRALGALSGLAGMQFFKVRTAPPLLAAVA